MTKRYMDYSTPLTIIESGSRAFNLGISKSACPIDSRTNANGVDWWNRGWEIAKTKTETEKLQTICKGINCQAINGREHSQECIAEHDSQYIQGQTMTNKIFLGGTHSEYKWREELIPLLEEHKIAYFNPIVDDWTLAAQKEEIYQKLHCCDTHLYVITSEMTGVFSIAEAVESAMTKNQTTTLFQVIPNGFSSAQLGSLKATCDLLDKYGTITNMNANIETILYSVKRNQLTNY